MKTFLIFLLILPAFINAQTTSVDPTQNKVEIACITNGIRDFSFSSSTVDRLLTGYMGNAIRVTNSRVNKHSSGSYFIHADVFYTQGWGTVAVVLEQIEGKLYISDNSCAHQCIPDASDPCLYKAEISEFSPCVQVTCICVGTGSTSSEVTLGQTRGLQRAALMMRNVNSNCE